MSPFFARRFARGEGGSRERGSGAADARGGTLNPNEGPISGGGKQIGFIYNRAHPYSEASTILGRTSFLYVRSSSVSASSLSGLDSWNLLLTRENAVLR